MLLIAVSLVPLEGRAANWTVVLRQENRDLVMVDAARLRREGALVRLWERTLYQTPHPDAFFGNPPIVTRERFLEFRCDERTFRVQRIRNLDAARALRSEERFPASAPFHPVADGSSDAAVMDFACRRPVAQR